MSETFPPVQKISMGRAFACLLLNVLVLPGAGTLVGGAPSMKRTGRLQFALSLTLLPFMMASSLGMAGLGSELARAWIFNFLIILMVWSFGSAVKTFLEAWRSRSAE